MTLSMGRLMIKTIICGIVSHYNYDLFRVASYFSTKFLLAVARRLVFIHPGFHIAAFKAHRRPGQT
jgi:hypothetical protein